MPRLTVQIRPGAKSSAVVGRVGETVKIAIAAPPIEGRANDALIKFLANDLGLAQSRIHILRGTSSRLKTLDIDAAPEVLQEWLSRIAPS